MTLPAQIRALLATELRIAWRSGETAFTTLPFAAVALLSFPLAIGTDLPLLQRIGPGVFWTLVVLFATFVVVRSAPGLDRDLVRLLGVDAAAGFAAAAGAGFVLLLGFEIVVGALAVVLYDFTFVGWGWLVVIVVGSAAGLSMLGTLADAVTTGLDARSALAPLLVVPLAIPILLAASQATEGLRLGTGNLGWVLLLILLDLVLAVIGVLTARPLQEASR